MKYRIICLFVIAFMSSVLYGQREGDNWYFGDGAGITFRNGSPQFLPGGKLVTDEGCAAISTAYGKLLLYTNGANVYNGNHTLITNGTGLFGNSTSTSSGVIIQKPGDVSQYFIVTSDANTTSPNTKGVCYSIVQLDTATLAGTVVTKNVLLHKPSTERIAVTKHENGVDYWIITRPWNSDSFYAYLLTSAGLDINPVKTQIGAYLGGTDDAIAVGVLKASLDGKKLALCIGKGMETIEIYKFDNLSGTLYDLIIIPQFKTATWGPYGAEFSPDGRLLYVSFMNQSVYQFDLATWDQTSVINSAVQVLDTGKPGLLQLGPDQRIYYARYNEKFLGVIRYPNIQGLGCYPLLDAVHLGTGKSLLGLPTFPQSVFRRSTFTTQANCLKAIFKPSEIFADYLYYWDFGDSSTNTDTSSLPETEYTYAKEGTYYVRLVQYHPASQMSDTQTNFIQLVSSQKKIFPSHDTALCPGFLLKTEAGGFKEIHWTPANLFNDPHALSAFMTSDNFSGKIYAEAKIIGCDAAIYDSLQINRFTKNHLVSADTQRCPNREIRLFSSGITGPDWSPAPLLKDWDTDFPLVLGAASQYFYVSGTDPNGCQVKDSVYVHNDPLPNISGLEDKNICMGDTVNIALNGFEKMQWQPILYLNDDTSRTQQISPPADINYYPKFILGACSVYDTFRISVTPIPQVMVTTIEPDTLCAPIEMVVNASGADKYFWSTGSTNDFTQVKAESDTIFWVTGTNGQCPGDTAKFRLNFYPRPTADFFFSPQNVEVPVQVTFINASSGASFYEWQIQNTISTSESFSMSFEKGGQFPLTLIAENIYGCKDTARQILLLRNLFHYYIPNAFSPNNDLINDIYTISLSGVYFYEMKIYNRWGQQVAVLTLNNPKWDGTFNGEPVPAGVYSYTFRVKSEDGIKENGKGFIHLLR